MSSKPNRWFEFIKGAPPYPIYIGYPMFTVLRDEILKHDGKTFLEYGFGTGYASMYLANQGFEVQGYDDCKAIVKLANEKVETIVTHKDGSATFTSNVIELKPADVVFSQGLLEHYSNEMIIKILKEQCKLAKKVVVFSVPAEKYPHRDMGDERLMPLSEWEAILKSEFNLIDMYCYYNRFFMNGVIRV